LIGDHKQLGPVYKCEVPRCDSMLTRLIEAKYPNFRMLKTQYRMHPFLLKVPNALYYDDKIESGYRIQFENKFISREYPMLFINCETEEQRYGTSYTNQDEARIVVDLVKHLTTQGMKYDKKKFGFVSPYQGQVQKLKESLTALELQDNVRTIDSWQGREKEYMIFSAVRCNSGGNVGFLENERRTNVALTRA
jgi:superfamily I DNA and/or RNA helicase